MGCGLGFVDLSRDEQLAFECAVSNNLRSVGIPDQLIRDNGCSSIDHSKRYYEQTIKCIKLACEKTIDW